MTLVESMAVLRKQLHDIESNTINEGLKDAVSAVRAGDEIIPSILKFWLKKPAVEIIKEFKTIEITLSNGTKEVWNATGIKRGKAMYSRAGDNAIASFEDVTKSGTVKNIKPEPYLKVPTAEKPRVKVNPGETLDQAMKRASAEAEKSEIKQVDVSGPDPLKRIEPVFKNVEAAKSAADAEIQAGNAIVKAPDGTVFQSAADMESFIAKNYPESAAALAKSPKKSMELWSWFSKPKSPAKPPRDIFWPPEPEKNSKKTILLVALLIALGIYFWPKDKTPPGGGGGGSSGDVSPAEAARDNAALGKHFYVINAENIDWNKAGMPELAGQPAQRTKEGKWTSQDGTEITSPKAIKALVKAYHDSPPIEVYLVPADSGGGQPAGEPTVTVPATVGIDNPNPDIQVDPNFDGKIKSSKSKAR